MVEARRINESEHHAEGKYRVLAELGQGGTATVLLAVARGPSGFNKLVVLKSLKQHLSEEPEFRNMFLNEARLAARLNHPNIVQTNEVAEERGVPVIVMEYLEGQPLSTVLARGRGGPFTQAMHLRVLADALAGLHYAHELADFDGTPLGVVHRDMTPHNVFVSFNGQVKVLDFGIAKLSTSLVETQTGVIKGKIRYMSPEQLSGDSIDRRADIFSVGVMLWEAACGERMWKGQSDTKIMHRVLNGDIPSPRTVNPDVPEKLERVVMKALAPAKEDRFATAAELEVAVEECLNEIGSVSMRDVSKVASVLFEDVRVKTKALIEAQLSKVASLSWAEYEQTEAPTMLFQHTMTGSTGSTGTTTGSGLTGSVEAMRGGPSRKRWLWLAVAGLSLIGVLAWQMNSRAEEDARRAAAAAAAAANAAAAAQKPAEKPKPDKVSIRLSAFPIEAKIYFDKELIPSNPYVKMMPPDGSRHIVHAEAEGYAPGTAAVVLDKDADVVLILERRKEKEKEKEASKPTVVYYGRPKRPDPPPQAAPQPAPPTPTPSKSANCDPPYFVDARGIKKFKPECM